MMASVFTVLGHDHVEVKAILEELEQGSAVTSGATAEQLEQRRALVERLIIEESRHEAVEEEYFWPAVREHVAGGDGLADHAISQESAGKEVLDELRKTRPDESSFDSLLSRFIKEGREHIGFEETEVWPKLEAVLSSEQAAELGEKIAQAKESAPTRPHPHTPANPVALKTAGSGAAMADKVRDAATGRGRD